MQINTVSIKLQSDMKRQACSAKLVHLRYMVFKWRLKVSAKLPGSKKTRSEMLCRSSGVQEAVQILGLKFSSEDEKSGKVTWEQKAHSAVQCRIMQCNAAQCRRERAAPASCSCLYRSLISTFQNAINCESINQIWFSNRWRLLQ